MGINDPKKDEDAEMFDEEEDLLEAPHPKTKEEALEEDFQVKLEEMRTQVLRTHAEMENLRQRTEKRIKDERQYALSSFAEKLVPVLDSLDQAVQGATESDPMMEGVKMTVKMFADVLANNGIKVLSPLNEKFNPALHEAMAMQPSDAVEPNTVLQVLQKGYVLNDRLIRPARVIVSRAP